MIRIPVYRPEIQVFYPAPDGGWDNPRGTFTWSMFEAMPDEDGDLVEGTEARRWVKHGTEPAFTILAPDGSELFERGRALYLRTPEDKALDAITALAYAKTRSRGLDLVRPGLIARPTPPPIVHREPARKQLDLFASIGGGS